MNARAWFAIAVAVLAGDRFAELKTQLTASDARQRREAVAELAKLDTLEAWKLVIGALKDGNSQVADEAQLKIAEIDDPAAMKELGGKDGLESKDDWVRLRVAEAVGRASKAPDAAPVLKLLNDKNESVRRTACWSIQRLGEKDRWNEEASNGREAPGLLVDVFRKDKDPGTRGAALIARSRFEGNSLSVFPIDAECRKAMADAAFEVRAAALIAEANALKAGDPAAVWSVAEIAAKDAHVGVRLNAVEYFASIKSKRAVLALVDTLDAEKELRARWRIVDLLRGLSGLAHRLDPRPWRDWANALPDDWHGESKPAAKEKDDGAQTTASFAGLPILSEHVCFVIDLSGSMWQKNKDGKMRKQVVDAELRKALESLPPSTEFNVIPYTSTPIPWSEHLVPADKKNVAKALDFFEGRKDNGTGNFWDAWMLALEDPKVDTVVMLSDGAPTGGHRWNLDLMRDLMAEHNRFRRVALDAVLADAKGALVAKWQAMCDDSGGRLVQVELR